MAARFSAWVWVAHALLPLLFECVGPLIRDLVLVFLWESFLIYKVLASLKCLSVWAAWRFSETARFVASWFVNDRFLNQLLGMSSRNLIALLGIVIWLEPREPVFLDDFKLLLLELCEAGWIPRSFLVFLHVGEAAGTLLSRLEGLKAESPMPSQPKLSGLAWTVPEIMPLRALILIY